MKTETKTPLFELPQLLSSRNAAFLCCASFEERSRSIPVALKSLHFQRTIIFACDDSYPKIKDKACEIRHLFDYNAEIVYTKSHEPLITANAMSKAVQKILNYNIDDIIIDITTFTREMLLILLRMLCNNKKKISRITCLYTGALDYSIGDTDERKWLSKGCKDVRSVFGFPGQLVPGRPTFLIVLVGFEHERATRMINLMDPDFLLLGKGIPSEEHMTNESHKAPMEYFHKLVQEMVSNRGNVGSFEFSCRHPYLTAETIQEKILATPEYNHIIVPLNTKISTVAVALTALANPDVQVCYAEPDTYNFENYSTPNNYATMFDLDWIDEKGKEELSNC